MKCQASILHGIGDLRLAERELEDPAKDEVQVAVECTGLCGSDLHYYKHFRNGDILVKEPLSLGHESAGTVKAVGSDVKHLAVGDRVALEVGVPCDQCRSCAQGRYNICKKLRFRSSGKSFPHFQGTLQERINHPAKWCHKLPDGVSTELGALLEPLGVALHAYRRSQAAQEARVLVIGAGAVGLLCAGVARLRGAKSVVLTDIDQGRLDFGVVNRFADESCLMPKASSEGDAIEAAKGIAERLQQVAGGEEYDIVFECTGIPACVQAGIFACSAGGRLMLVGMGHPVQTVPISAAALREVDIVGVFRYANTYPESISIIQAALQDERAPAFGQMVTHRVTGLANVSEAFELASTPVDTDGKLVLKVVVTSSDDL